jgi:aminoglycoside phosphotransferase family enzyme/predicted kinase
MDAAVVETHSAVVVFLGDRAYKLKKPVDLGFLDFRSRLARAGVCAREVALNRRIAPDVYLGVADVVDAGGRPCDHLVVMRRMPADRCLSRLIEVGADVRDGLVQLARLVAAFHARAERGPAADAAARPESLRRRWTDNTTGLLRDGDGIVDLAGVAALDDLAGRYLAGREPLFARRIAEGRAVDGHGDLLADDIFMLDDGPRVLDCVEFDDRLRRGDTLADVAFLAMDLERLGRPDLAELFLASYREHAADAWPPSLAHHHIAYRAQVRAKVAAIRARQGDADAAGRAQDLLDLARRHAEAGAMRVVLVGGLPGTGKSTIARDVGDRLDAVVLRSDELRKELAGLDALAPAGDAYREGIYRPEMTAATYEAMLARAATALAHGHSVVLDASFSDGRWRQRARTLAGAAAAGVTELLCEAPPLVAALRIEHRMRTGSDSSDATPAIAAAMGRDADPWPGAVRVTTTGDLEATLAAARAAAGVPV